MKTVQKAKKDRWISQEKAPMRIQPDWTYEVLIKFMKHRKFLSSGNEVKFVQKLPVEDMFRAKKVNSHKVGTPLVLEFKEVFLQTLKNDYYDMIEEEAKSELVYLQCLPIMDEYDKNIEHLDSLRLSLKKDYDQKIAEIERKAYEKTA